MTSNDGERLARELEEYSDAHCRGHDDCQLPHEALDAAIKALRSQAQPPNAENWQRQAEILGGGSCPFCGKGNGYATLQPPADCYPNTPDKSFMEPPADVPAAATSADELIADLYDAIADTAVPMTDFLHRTLDRVADTLRAAHPPKPEAPAPAEAVALLRELRKRFQNIINAKRVGNDQHEPRRVESTIEGQCALGIEAIDAALTSGGKDAAGARTEEGK